MIKWLKNWIREAEYHDTGVNHVKIIEIKRPLLSESWLFLITFNCPHCNVQKKWRVHENSWRGRVDKDDECNYCHKKIIIPFEKYLELPTLCRPFGSGR